MGNKVEFDCAIEVQLTRVNMVVTCKLSIISRNETLTEDLFQVSHHTLKEADGLRYQVVATGLEDQEVDVQLGWVSGGDNNDKGCRRSSVTKISVDGNLGVSCPSRIRL